MLRITRSDSPDIACLYRDNQQYQTRVAVGGARIHLTCLKHKQAFKVAVLRRSALQAYGYCKTARFTRLPNHLVD
ncbi:hypothetical protein GWI33_011752 [Rhynchophorus ferrugineus]|uniref:Uncharacterized protein n=1 Tax=Rhynchophorus ferrugineus TaxID=354439 RepID=A0A834IAH9_RHYFE|nr:hypothetical protein GWI33_011752 [Rhynchophorus ferrugineus]